MKSHSHRGDLTARMVELQLLLTSRSYSQHELIDHFGVDRETGVEWVGRAYRRERWADADPFNRALSAANSCLYGICHAAIVSAGYSPALGFVHRQDAIVRL